MKYETNKITYIPKSKRYIEGIKKKEEEKIRFSKSNEINLNKGNVIVYGDKIPKRINNWNELKLGNNEIIKNFFKTPNIVQSYSVPIIEAGRDIIFISPTGTGKTAAFGIGTIKRIIDLRKIKEKKGYGLVWGIILAPTRELSTQIYNFLKDLGDMLGVKVSHLCGGESYEIQNREILLEPDLIVGTPGKIEEYIINGDLRIIKDGIMIIDEADKIFQQGYNEIVKKILNLQRNLQIGFFSATIDKSTNDIIEKITSKPIRIEIIGKQNVIEMFGWASSFKIAKEMIVNAIIDKKNRQKTIIFVSRKDQTKEISNYLSSLKINNIMISGLMSSENRKKAMNDFCRDNNGILITTDLIGRGIDIGSVNTIINYGIPERDTYYHRIGRCGRRNTVGKSYTIRILNMDNETAIPDIQEAIFTESNEKMNYWKMLGGDELYN